MSKFSTVLLSVVLSIVAAIITIKTVSPKASAITQNPEHESVYGRVMNAKTIRCGYLVRPPFFVKDPNTKALSGIFYDITEELGKRLSLKINWVEETTPAEFIVGLENDRFDTVCHGVWSNAQRARVIDFSNPVLYDVVGVFSRGDDQRFQGKTLQELNVPDLKFSVMEGSPTQNLTELNFPKAQKVTTPQGTTPAQVALDLTAGKTDLALYPLSEGILFETNNPGKIHPLASAGSLGAFSMSYPLRRGQDEFRQMINNALLDIENQGVIDKILSRYSAYNDVIKKVDHGYRN